MIHYHRQRGSTRVLFSCTGVGVFNRGIESFFREAFDGIKATPGLEVWLVKGSGETRESEFPVPCLPRTGKLARLVGHVIGRNAYVAEQLTSFPFVVERIRHLRPDVVFYSDSNLGFQLFRWRRMIGVPFRLLFSNGGPCRPPFDRTDFVHQVAPYYHEQAVGSGECPERHFMVPYGIQVGDAPSFDPLARRALRGRLGMPVDRPVVLSAGWISRKHKRMHYLIEELSQLPMPRPFLQMLGAMDESSQEIVLLAEQLLGPDGFSARSVPYHAVSDYYRAADVFALASLQEGFGRVYLEALMHGLPVIAHQHPVMKYVLGGLGYLRDLTRKSELALTLTEVLAKLPDHPDHKEALRRWASVRDRFSWPILAPRYASMFASVAAHHPRQGLTQ
jgi:glycosyltransferase involved in cell wall biosynthesis